MAQFILNAALDTPSLSEARLLRRCFGIWAIEHDDDPMPVIAHFAWLFERCGLPCTETHIKNALAGRTTIGDEAWAVVMEECGDQAKEQRGRWLLECTRRAAGLKKKEK